VESFSSSLMVSVGTGWDYATLNEALTDLSKLHVSFPANYDPMSQGAVSVPTAIIMLMPGYVITEPVICNAINLSWIMVASAAQAMSEDVALWKWTLTLSGVLRDFMIRRDRDGEPFSLP
jgi:hypothetical protein